MPNTVRFHSLLMLVFVGICKTQMISNDSLVSVCSFRRILTGHTSKPNHPGPSYIPSPIPVPTPMNLQDVDAEVAPPGPMGGRRGVYKVARLQCYVYSGSSWCTVQIQRSSICKRRGRRISVMLFRGWITSLGIDVSCFSRPFLFNGVPFGVLLFDSVGENISG